VTEFHSDPLTNRRTGEESEVAPYLPQLLPVGRSKMPCSAFNSTTRPRNLRRLTLIGTMLVILVPAISHAQSVTIGPGSEGIRLTFEKLIRRDAFFPEAMSVHLIVENLDAKPAEQLTIHCRAVDVDGFTLERSRPRDGTVSNLQPAEKLRIVVSIPEHASTNKVVCNIN
jgi:hypothetical protein